MATGASYTLTFDAAASGGSDILEYVVRSAIAGAVTNTQTLAPSGAAHETVTIAADDTADTVVYVQARNGLGLGPAGTVTVPATPAPTPPPPPPTMTAPTITATGGDTTFTITQNQPGSSYDHLRLSYHASGNLGDPYTDTVIDPVTLPYTVTGLTNGRIYDVALAAVAADGTVTPAGYIPVTPASAQLLAPTMTYTAGYGSITFAASSAGSGYTTMRAEVHPTNGDAAITADHITLPYTVTGLSAGETYICFTVVTNSAGQYLQSNTGQVVPTQQAITVPTLDGSRDYAAGTATVTLTSAGTGYDSLDLYNANDDTLIVHNVTFPYTASGLDSATDYGYYVIAVNSSNQRNSDQVWLWADSSGA